MRTIFLFSLISFFCFTSFISKNKEGKDKLDWMLGTWKGTGYQSAISIWSIDMEFPNLNTKPKVSYSSLGCMGIWNIKEVKDNRAIFTENIESGVDKCIQGGEVVITYINERHISLAFFHSDYSDDVMAFSVLVKQ